jgi:hypothetical protein
MPLDVGHDTQCAIEGAGARDGLSVEAHLQPVLLTDSLRRHAAWGAEHPGVDEWAAREADAAAAAREA